MPSPLVRRADFPMALTYATGHSRDIALRSCVLGPSRPVLDRFKKKDKPQVGASTRAGATLCATEQCVFQH
jgi:hypothetical protein